MTCVLLKARKKESLVFANGSTNGEPVNIVAKNRFRNPVQFVHIGNRIEPLRLIAPQQRAMDAVRAGLCDHVEYAAAGLAELDAEVAGLRGDFLDSLGDGEWLRGAVGKNIAVFSPIQEVIVSTWALTVCGKS